MPLEFDVEKCLPLTHVPDPAEVLQQITDGIGRDFPLTSATGSQQSNAPPPSALMVCAERFRSAPNNALGLELRHLSEEEIGALKQAGCTADDWSRIRVGRGFDPKTVADVQFVGDCVLGAFAEPREVAPGVALPSGVYRALLVDCQVGDHCLVRDVRCAAGVVLESRAVLFDVGSVTGLKGGSFGCGRAIPVGSETGGREVPLWAELTLPAAEAIARHIAQREARAALCCAVQRYADVVRCPVSWLGEGAAVLHTPSVTGVYLGPAARVQQASEVANTCVLSSPEEGTVLGAGAVVVDSVVQFGVRVDGHAVVRQSALLEHSAVEDHAVVIDSVVGPNTHIAKGEVTASLVGPFVGFHHQSMLIAAVWPEGRGNIAHGAQVGSNHSGRLNDQEVWPGEANFFGLGCLIRFPADYSRAPYTLLAAGVSTLPQRMDFPFSLIMEATSRTGAPVSKAINELLPGWGLHRNAYATARFETKFQAKDHSRRHTFDFGVLRPDVVRLIWAALQTLEALPAAGDKAVYTEADCPGIGKNVMTEEARQQGAEAYRDALRRFALRRWLGTAEAGGVSAASRACGVPDTDPQPWVAGFLEAERRFVQNVFAGRQQDDLRGARIIDDYTWSHVLAKDDPVVKRCQRQLADLESRAHHLLSSSLL